MTDRIRLESAVDKADAVATRRELHETPYIPSANIENAFWRDNYRSRLYVKPGASYEAYRPAYQYGWESHHHAAGRPWRAIEADLRKGWEHKNDQSTLPWSEACPAIRDAWDRINSR